MDFPHTTSSMHHVHKFEAIILLMQVGNALIDDFHDRLGLFQFMWTAGLISDQTFKQLNLFCDLQSFVHESVQCGKIEEIAYSEFGNIDPYSIFTPTCTLSVDQSSHLLRRWNVSIKNIMFWVHYHLICFPFVWSDSPFKILVHYILDYSIQLT